MLKEISSVTSVLLYSGVGRRLVATKRSDMAPTKQGSGAHTVNTKEQGLWMCFINTSRGYTPINYDSTTMKSIEAAIRPAVEPVRRPTHTDTLATSHVGITEIDNFDSPGKRSLVATLSPAVRVMPVLEYRGTPIYVPTALKRSLERSEEVSPYVPKRLRLSEEIGPKPGVSIGEERRPSSVICTPPPRKVECDCDAQKEDPLPSGNADRLRRNGVQHKRDPDVTFYPTTRNL